MINKALGKSKEFFRGLLDAGIGLVWVILLVILALGLIAGIVIGVIYLLYLGWGYVLPVLYPPAAAKLAELGFWGFFFSIYLIRWALNFITSPFIRNKVVEEDD